MAMSVAMSRAVEGGRRAPRTRVRLVVTAYRDWALRYRRRHGVLFGERAGGLPSVARAAILTWTRVHGIVGLELTGVFENHTVEA
ncbi:hypothetical protein ABZT28_17005 [Streptomyces sp. NPDC005388]|uniref:hypothetical protein n=1 Tax=Streptomyces sp. NPDC005388 TaxID=3156717 RepID=UPI0033AA11F2